MSHVGLIYEQGQQLLTELVHMRRHIQYIMGEFEKMLGKK